MFDIIGKNSRLYAVLKPYIKDINNELSQNDIYSKSINNPIVFGYSKKSLQENIDFLQQIINSAEGIIIYVSTTAIYSNLKCNSYNYPRIKKEIENFLLGFENVKIIRIGLPENLVNRNDYYGTIKYSSISRICDSFKEALISERKIINAWENVIGENKSTLHKFHHLFYKFLSHNLGDLFFLTRPIDLICKILNIPNYGYTYLSNNYRVLKSHLVIGAGMSSLGVCEALTEKIDSKKIWVIHDKTGKGSHQEYNSVNKNSLEITGQGGNSSLWHSVISKFNLENQDLFKKKFSKIYGFSFDSDLYENFSFIPLIPLRPLKKITKLIGRRQIINDKVLLIEFYKNKLEIHTTKGSLFCNKIHLCTGTFSSLELLYNSNLIKESNIKLSDHLVGYFGQIDGRSKEETLFFKNGHLKKFHNIPLDNRSIYASLRPAVFGFNNMKIADEFRNFFGTGSNTILKKLIKKFHLGLFIEAVYNKFGLKYPFHAKINIVGHIDSNNQIDVSLEKFNKPKIRYKEKTIRFKDGEKTEIKKYFRSIGYDTNIFIRNEVKVSPGIHFLNCSVREEIANISPYIICHGTYLMENTSSKHPSFDLYIRAYDLTKKKN